MSTRYTSNLRVALIATSTALVLSACMVGPDYVRPSVHVPVAYKEANATNTAASDTKPISDTWWEIYHDPTLNALVSQVSINNQSLAAAAARLQEAQALIQVASGASKPSVNVGSFKSGRKNVNDFGLGVSWELDLWGRVRRDVQAHQASAQASEADLAGATLSMQAQLVQSYFALRQDDALLELLQHAVDASLQWQQMVKNQYAQGIVSSADLAQALAHASATQQQLADIKIARAQLEHAIAVMLGKQPAEFSIAPAPFNTDVPQIPTGVPATLLERRPDVIASERRMAAASARIGVSKAEMLPSISLLAGIGIRRGPTVTPNISAPLFAGGRLKAQVGNAGAAYDEAVANYKQTVLDAYREVEDGLVAANTLGGNADLQAQAAAAATEANRVVQNQYREGVADYSAVVDASSAALDAGRGALQLRQRRLSASVDLIKALGGGWQQAQEAQANQKTSEASR